MICIGVLILTSLILKFNWWDKLEASYGEQKNTLSFPISEKDPSGVLGK
jgi:hypothetical protein